MMDASLPADQSGLSDLSTASITDIAQPYIGPASPPINQQQQPATPAHINATPGPSRIRTATADRSGAAWTPSPDASSSRSKSTGRSVHRRNGSGNESMASSMGTFDYSNASFSESFLRQAGARMLAGLDEADLPPAAASSSVSASPRYRTSSSPTVTARPIRAADPRTPFTGKSLRTRMAEAGMIDSPTSSDGSSPASSPTTRMLPDSYTRSISLQQEERQQHSPMSSLHSPRVDRFSAAYSPSLERFRQGREDSPLQHERSMVRDGEWQEGLSMVPEESYVEDTSQLPSSPAVEHAALQRSMVLAEQSTALEPVPDASTSSVSAPNQATDANIDTASPEPVQWPETSPDNDAASSQAPSPEANSAQDSDASSTPAKPSSSPASPRSRPASPPATPLTTPRTVHTPRSFARLRVGTPVRSSPLSRVVTFSPAPSSSAASQWQSPVSQRSSVHVPASSPAPSNGETGFASVLEQDDPFASTKEHAADAVQPSPASTSRWDMDGKEHASHPQTPAGATPVQQAAATPSHLWSPATSASFATPASHRQQPPSAPTTPALSQPRGAAHSADEFSSPAAADFDTPQWSPSPAPVSAKVEPTQEAKLDKPELGTSTTEPLETEQDEAASSSACSSSSAASERKQSGDVSTSSQPAIAARKGSAPDVSLASATQHDSPSAARFSRMQLSRLPPPSDSTLAAVPELGLVASAFDSLSQLSDTRVARLVAQLAAATTRIDELESALEAREAEQAELHEVRGTLSQLEGQYDELVREADEKDTEVARLVQRLRVQVQVQVQEGRGGRERELEKQLEEERRRREVERRDYEVRIQALMGPAVAVTSVPSKEGADSGDQHAAVEQAKEQLRLTLEKDFDIRRAMEQRDLQCRVEQLERELAAQIATLSNVDAAVADHERDSELQRQVDHLTSELDRRFEELHDLREDIDSLTTQKERAEEQVLLLEQQLDEARAAAADHSNSGAEINAQLEEELDDLRSTLDDRNAEIERLQETLSLTDARLASLASEHEQLRQSQVDAAARAGQLEAHILTLETQLRTRTPPAKPTESPPAPATAAAAAAAAGGAPGTPAPDRIVKLERQLASLQLELLKLGKANDALQEDNVHFSIALSAKQLELGMVKRNARFALKNAQARLNGATAESANVGLPRSKAPVPVSGGEAVVFPAVPKGEFVEAEKENVHEVQVNQARLHARQMLAQRRAAGQAGGGQAASTTRRARTMMAA